MTIQEMKEKKKEIGYTYSQIAELSGVPLGTVQKIFNGSTSSPRYDTLRALEKVFQLSFDEPKKPTDMIREASAPYFVKKQGDYTLEDYYAIPDDIRVELIDGVIYDMSAPTSVHQLLTGFLFTQFMNHVMKEKGSCLPIVSPIDVQLDCDDRTMLQPDVVIVGDRKKVVHRCVYGAPDFVLEILSPSSRKKDSIIKLNKYMNAGVREYWVVDPEKRLVLVYDFEHNNFPIIYGFDSQIPVRIWEEKLVLDFREASDHIQFLYEDR